MSNTHKKDFRFSILFVSFFSGLSVLIYELVWSRYLTLIFGSSVFAVSTVLACFMVGLALGSWLIGKWVDTSKTGIQILIYLQIGIGLYGLFSPILFSITNDLNINLLRSMETTLATKQIIRLSLSFLILIFPTLLMGGTLPTIISIFNQHLNKLGKDAANVYAVNTLGGVFGAFLTGFFFIKLLGIKNTIYLAVLIDLLLAYIAFNLYKKIRKSNILLEERKKIKLFGNNQAYSKKLVSFVLFAFALSGFTSLSYEVYWTKILTLFFGDSVYDFAIVLSTFLFGIGIGSYIFGKVFNKIKNSVFSLAMIEILIGLFSILCLFLIHQLPYIVNYLQSMSTMYSMYGEWYWIMATIIKFGYAFLVMLLPTILFGATFPLVSQICIKSLKTTGRGIGIVNGMNTLGATIGSLSSGFLFISLFGIQKSVILTAILNVGIGLLLISFVLNGKKIKIYSYVSTILIVAIMITSLPSWDKLRMSTSFLEPDQEIENALSLLYYNEDAYGITSVVDFTPWNQKYLTTNRIYTQNTSDLMGLEDHRRLGHIPLLLHKQPESALVIGLGAGITLRGVSEHHLKTTDVVEISSGVKKAAAYFSEENDNVLENPDINFIIEDGRNYIATSNKKYDVIIGDILFPMSSGSSHMFSKEYFELSKERLKRGGIMAQWLPIHQLSLQEIQIISKTFKQAFSNTSIWYGMVGESVPVIGLIGADQEYSISLRSIIEKYNDPSLVKELEEIGLNSPYLLLSNYITHGNAIDQFAGDQPINQDDHPILEFMNPKLSSQYVQRGQKNLFILKELTEEISPFLSEIGESPTKIRDINNLVTLHQRELKEFIEGMK